MLLLLLLLLLLAIDRVPIRFVLYVDDNRTQTL
jgi:hypothetical protein